MEACTRFGLVCWFSSGLGLLVTWLSDPDNLNQLVVSQLDSVTSKGSVEDLCESDQEQSPLAPQEGKGDGSEGWAAVISCTPVVWPGVRESKQRPERPPSVFAIGPDLVLFGVCFLWYISRSIQGAEISTNTKIKGKSRGMFLWLESVANLTRFFPHNVITGFLCWYRRISIQTASWMLYCHQAAVYYYKQLRMIDSK